MISERATHFRAHERRAARLPVELTGLRSGREPRAVVVDLSIAGAGLETEEPLAPGERLTVTLATPTMWDPLVLRAVVAWAHASEPRAAAAEASAPRVWRVGIVFDYADASAVLAMFEMLTTLGYE